MYIVDIILTIITGVSQINPPLTIMNLKLNLPPSVFVGEAEIKGV